MGCKSLNHFVPVSSLTCLFALWSGLTIMSSAVLGSVCVRVGLCVCMLVRECASRVVSVSLAW